MQVGVACCSIGVDSSVVWEWGRLGSEFESTTCQCLQRQKDNILQFHNLPQGSSDDDKPTTVPNLLELSLEAAMHKIEAKLDLMMERTESPTSITGFSKLRSDAWRQLL